MTEHSQVVGGSSAGRVIACPPSRLHVENVPKQPASVYAEKGSKLHDAMEAWLAGTKPQQIYRTFDADDEFKFKFKTAARAWGELLDKYKFEGESFAEQRVEFTEIPGAFGTIDVFLHHKKNDAVTVLDWKFGDGIMVEADSAQNKFYAAAALHDKELSKYFTAHTKVHLAIIQPNDRGAPVLREHWTDVIELFEFTRKLKWAVDNGHRDELLNSGAHCRFCPVNPVCPKLRGDGETALDKWKDPHNLEPDELAAALAQADALESWIRELRAHAHDCLEHGKAIPGWKLVPRRATRQWKDEAEVIAWANAEGLTLADLYDNKLKSPAALEKITDSVPEGLYEKRSSGTTIAREDDKRDSTVSSAVLESFVAELAKSNLRR